MEKSIKRIAVTGSAGQIAYSLLFRIAKGELLGADQPVGLHLLDLPQSLEVLRGVEMELNDCAYPLLKELKVGSDPEEMFEGVDLIFLVGAKPRGPGMERKDLLSENGKIFVNQGKAINKVANKNAFVLTIGNPCNTNCLICMHNAPDIPRNQFFAMTRLDQNRAMHQLAKRAQCDISEVTNMTIWGNHSATQVPDFTNARIHGKKAPEIIQDDAWLKGEFFTLIQQRGAEVIKARGKSSAASAANAAMDSMRSLLHSTPPGNWFSCAIDTNENPYGIEKDLVFSFPLRSSGEGHYEIVKDLQLDDFISEKMKKTEQELMEERDLVRDLL